jgi:NAD-dependent histone deacetylase SIR2
MTIFLPLEASSSVPQSPAFLIPSPDPIAQINRVIKAILKAKRIVIVCGAIYPPSHHFERGISSLHCYTGAGISVQAGIPDFRSSEGLFQTLKRDNPREALSSGKDLFDASVFNVSIQYTICAAPGHVPDVLPACWAFLCKIIVY